MDNATSEQQNHRIDETLIKEIVSQVMALLTGQKAGKTGLRVVVVFSGASTGPQEGLEAIRMLSRDGHRVVVVLSAAGKHLSGGVERLRSAGAQQVFGPDEWVDTPGLVHEADLVLVPTLSMNFAAHLAMGLMDSPAATLVLGALLASKPVLALADGADPDGAGGRVFGGTGAPALRARLQGNLKTLASYGMELVRQADFIPAVRRFMDGRQAAAQAISHQASRPAAIMTQADVSNLPVGSVLHLAPGSRLTPLASETLARLQIQIIQE